MQQGATLGEALESALTDLDGFFTFVVGTKDGFGVVRDPIACKPAVMAETDQYVAFGSEYRALVNLPGIDAPASGNPSPPPSISGPTDMPIYDIEADGPARPERGASRAGRHRAERAVGGREPKGSHAIAVGLDAPLDVTVKGSTGYYCGGMNKQATIRVAGSVGPGVAENMMSGTVIVEGDASQYAGATGHGGLLVIKGNASRPLRDLDEGDRHRGAREYRAHVGLHGAGGQPCRLRRCGRGAGRQPLRSAAFRAGQGEKPRRRLRGEGDAARASGASADLLERAECDAKPEEFRRYGSARKLYNFHIDNAY
jgi:hypothetical protein